MLSAELTDRAAREFPYPIAHSIRKLAAQPDSPEACCHAYQQVLEFLTVVLVADYTSSENRSSDVDEHLTEILEGTRSLGFWLGWIKKILANREGHEWKPFVSCFASPASEAALVILDKLLEHRNIHTHERGPLIVDDFHEGLQALLGLLSPLRKYELFNPHTVRDGGSIILSDLLRGHDEQFAQVEVRTSLTLELEKLYLHSAETHQVLCLHPWIYLAPCTHCKRRHYYKINRAQTGKLVYSSLPACHQRYDAGRYRSLREIYAHTKTPDRPRALGFSVEEAPRPGILKPGSRLGSYAVGRALHLGSSTQVYEARDTRTGKVVALKRLPLEISRDTLLHRCFDAEIHGLKGITHPNVARYIEDGEENGERYLVLELATGGRLRLRRCQDLSQARKPIFPWEVVKIAHELCSGLEAIHALGRTHCDLKPSNLLLAKNDVQITDFGVVWGPGDIRFAMTGRFVGSPEYMAPEQVRGGKVDLRADLYALGCILYELATGRPPFRSQDALLTANLQVHAKPIHARALNGLIHKGLSNIIMKLLQKDASSRYQSAAEVREHLSRYREDPAGNQDIPGQKSPQDEAAEGAARARRRARQTVAAGLLFSLCSIVGLFGWQYYEATKKERYISGLIRTARSVFDERSRHYTRESSPFPKSSLDVLLENLQTAHREDRGHAAVRSFLLDLFNQGSLRIITQPPSEIEVTPFDGQAESLGLPEPEAPLQVPYPSGSWIPLRVGYYKIRFRVGGKPVPDVTEFVYIDHEKHMKTDKGWVGSRLPYPPKDPLSEMQSDVFFMARHVEIAALTLPTCVPTDMAFVGSGPVWTTADPMNTDQFSFARDEQNVEVYDGSHSLRTAEIRTPFFMGKTEVTVGLVRKWFDRDAEGFRLYRRDRDSKFHIPYMETRGVPMQVQLECWRSELEARGIPIDVFENSEQLLRTVFKDQLEYQLALWLERTRFVREHLDSWKAEQDAMPMSFISRDFARAYARTHAEIDRDELGLWLQWRVDGCLEALSGLEELLDWAAGQPEDILPSSIPTHMSFRCRWGCDAEAEPETALFAYTQWLGKWTFYACQVPGNRIAAWLRNTREVPGVNIGEVGRNLEKPSFWLRRKKLKPQEQIQNARTDESVVILKYAKALQEDTELIDREHFMAWLRARVIEEHDKCERFGGYLADLNRMDPEKDLDFRLRFEYGDEIGFDLPSPLQFDKGFRGCDARAYPWGNTTDDFAAMVRQSGDILLPVGLGRNEFERDTSLYGIYGMAGSLSEWVFIDNDDSNERQVQFLKGSHFGSSVAYASPRYFRAVKQGEAKEFTGFRVIREFKPFLRKRCELLWAEELRRLEHKKNP